MMLVAALSLVGAVLLALPPSSAARLARLASHQEGDRRAVRWRRLIGPGLVLCGSVTGWLAASGRGLAVGWCCSLVAVTCWAVLIEQRVRRRSRQRGEQVVAGCLTLAGLMRVGHVPAAALRIAAEDSTILREAAAVQGIGGEVPASLRRLGAEPGTSGLVELAIAWEVAARTGASLTATLDALVDRLDAARALRRVVEAELSAPRATSRLLAGLPLAGLGLGYAFGGDPLDFLLGTGLGQVALCGGVGLACAGVWWTERIARAAGG